jgi:hypothetical protein
LIAHIVVLEELCVLEMRDRTPITSYEIDARRAIVVGQGIIRRRPRFEQWSTRFTFQYDPGLVDKPELIIEVLNDAGTRVGVGDYRPECSGWFGRFRVRCWKPL